MGRPSASTTRPRKPSPTGTDRIRPVCVTASPSGSRFNAMSRAPEKLSRLAEAASDRPVEDLVADVGDDPSDHARVEDDLDLQGLAGRLRERLGQPGALLVGERHSGTNLGERVPAAFGRQLCEALHDPAELAPAAGLDD